jgi:thiol-disulfide isomerase/thioredoxin
MAKGTLPAWIKIAFLSLVTFVFIPYLRVLVDNNADLPNKPLGLLDLEDKGNFYSVVRWPKKFYYKGPNDKDVVWAVFFHRPYCGACRRIRPALEALGNTVNASRNLRFAALDCTKYGLKSES